MSGAAATPSSSPADPTFRSFNHDQAQNYAQNRRSPNPKLYQTIIESHTSTGGRLDTILDVGCGPGTAVRALGPHFVNAIGFDPSEGMISTAHSLGGVSSNSKPVRFELSTAEELGSNLSPPIADGSVDLITAATAAHWFDMEGFWPRAAQVLKPGGSVALWGGGSLRVHPSMPDAAVLQATIDRISDLLMDYMMPGNWLTRNMYVDLPLPWTLTTPVPEFDEASFLRREWNTGSEFDSGGDEFFSESRWADMDAMEKTLGTSSPVLRWREAHPDAVGTEKDVVRVIRREIEQLLQKTGVEEGKEMLKGITSGVLLVVKKRAEPIPS